MRITKIVKTEHYKLIAVQSYNKRVTILCDWNLHTNEFKMFDSIGVNSIYHFNTFRECLQFIFNL
jgi:hypothetical protein